MSNFGPPGGGSPEPWGGPRPDDGYAPDPRHGQGYGAQPGWGEPPTQRYEPPTEQYDPQRYAPPTQRYEPTDAWDAGHPPVVSPQQGYPVAAAGPGSQLPYAEPAPPKRGKGPLVAVLAVLLVLVLGGAGAWYVLGRDEPGTTVSAATGPTAVASEPAAGATTAPAPASSTDPRFVKAGQCVRNDGSAGDPKLVISACADKTYQVLRRIDGATSGKKDAQTKCAKVAGYTDWYFFDSQLDTLDFVLCLKRR